MCNIGFDWLLITIGACGGIQLFLILNKTKLHVWDLMFIWDGQITCTLFWRPAFTLGGQGFKTEIGTASRWETSNSNPLGPIKLSS
jgi:hypothetical protein